MPNKIWNNGMIKEVNTLSKSGHTDKEIALSINTKFNAEFSDIAIKKKRHRLNILKKKPRVLSNSKFRISITRRKSSNGNTNNKLIQDDRIDLLALFKIYIKRKRVHCLVSPDNKDKLWVWIERESINVIPRYINLNNELFRLLGLIQGDGTKTHDSRLEFSNSDPHLITLFIHEVQIRTENLREGRLYSCALGNGGIMARTYAEGKTVRIYGKENFDKIKTDELFILHRARLKKFMDGI